MIHGLSNLRRFPRAGLIKLGVLVEEPGKKPYPKATDHFVCPETVTEALGEAKPKRLPIMFPTDDIDRLFPQTLKAYRASGLWCQGDGQAAKRWGAKGNLMDVACPCALLDSGECKPTATLNFVLPDVPGAGVWQITLRNKRSIVALNTALEQFTATFGGLSGIPFYLLLEPQMVQRYDEKREQMVKQTVYVLRLDSPYSLRQIIEWREKAGRPVGMLMPASVEDAEAIPDEDEPEPGAPARQESKSAPAAEPQTEEWDVSRCFLGAERCGVSSVTYTQYLEVRYQTDLDNVPPAGLAEQALKLKLAESDPKEAISFKLHVLQTLKDAAGKARGR